MSIKFLELHECPLVVTKWDIASGRYFNFQVFIYFFFLFIYMMVFLFPLVNKTMLKGQLKVLSRSEEKQIQFYILLYLDIIYTLCVCMCIHSSVRVRQK